MAEPRTASALPPAAHLPGLVAELRAVVCDPVQAGAVREAAAAELATLAAAGVPGADPSDWWGLAPLSTTAGVRDPDETVRVSPSRIESFLQCELRTLMQQFGVDDRDNPAAELGTLIHALAEAAPEGQTWPTSSAPSTASSTVSISAPGGWPTTNANGPGRCWPRWSAG